MLLFLTIELLKEHNYMIKKSILNGVLLTSALFLLSACASNGYNGGYYMYQDPNEKAINNTISSEVNSLSSQDIAALNTLK